MRKETNQWEQKNIRGEVGDGKQYPVRLSQLRGEDVAATNATADVKSIDADKVRRSGENDSTGGNVNSKNQRGFESSRIQPKSEAKPMLAGEVDKPLADPKQLGPAKVAAHDWRNKKYAKSLDKPYKKNSQTNQPSLARSRKPKSL